MRMNAWSAVLTGCLLTTCMQAGPAGHYVNGVEGLKAASLPPPGLYYRMYNAYYDAGRLRDNDGNRLPVDFQVKVFANVHRLIWVSPVELLGGNLFMDALIPILYTDLEIGAMEIADDRWGMGDPFVEPLGLTWRGGRYDAAIGAGVYLPWGQYATDKPASAGKDMWTLMLTAGATAYLDARKTLSASLLSRFEAHSSQDALDIRPGNRFHFEYGLGKRLPKGLEFGLAGYCHWQVSDAKGDDLPPTVNPGDRDRVFAIGPEISVFVPRYTLFASLRGLSEFGARGKSEGNLAVLTLTRPL